MDFPDTAFWQAKICGAGAGRYAPSPSGDLHLGNLRTALLAWAYARKAGKNFYLRIEDLDTRSRPLYVDRQLRDLEALGITWDATPIKQSERQDFYDHCFQELQRQELLYPCYCTRRELAEIASAPHTPPGAYPGICRNLSPEERTERAAACPGRQVAWRLRMENQHLEVHDKNLGLYCGLVDDFVLKRGDGVYSYNFVSVLDDADMGITQIVRGDDLLPSTPRQVYLQQLLGIPRPEYCHVPLVLNMAGQRLAKRDGAVTFSQLRDLGLQAADIVQLLAASLGWEEVRSSSEFLEVFTPEQISPAAWRWPGVGAEKAPE